MKEEFTDDRNANIAVLLDIRMPDLGDKFLFDENKSKALFIDQRSKFTIFGGFIG